MAFSKNIEIRRQQLMTLRTGMRRDGGKQGRMKNLELMFVFVVMLV